MANFGELLKELRHGAGMTQQRLADGTGVSVQTVVSYESGRRKPLRGSVLDLARTLRLDADATDRLLSALGLAPEPPALASAVAKRRSAWPTVQAELSAYTWPCLVMNEFFEIIGWNAAANDVAEMDLGRDLSEPGGRHQLRMACRPHFRERMLNWDDVIGVMISMYRFESFEVNAPAQGDPYFNALVAELYRDHPDFLPHLIELWAKAEPFPHYSRATWKVEWRVSDGTLLRFDATLTGWNYFDGSGAQDWYPADATTWRWMDDRRRARLARLAGPEPEPGAEPERTGLLTLTDAPWNDLLRSARERVQMSRRELAAAARGVSESALYSYEAGRRRPSRETLVEILDAMQADTATTNMVLDAAGYEGELADWARFVSGLPIRGHGPRHQRKGDSRSWAEMQREIDGHHWPSLIISGSCEVMCGNAAATLLTGIDFRRLPVGETERSLLYFISDRRFREHVPGWKSVASQVLPGTLTPYFGPERHEPGAQYFRQVVEAIRHRDPAVLHELLDLWRSSDDRRLRTRIAFPLRWLTGDGRELNFQMLLTPWNEVDPGWALDWHPADAETWEWFEAQEGAPA